MFKFKFIIASLYLARMSYAIKCNDEFDIDPTRTFMKDGLIVYGSRNKARIYNISTNECLISFVGSRIDYPLSERILTLNTRQYLKEDVWDYYPVKVAIDYLKQNGHLGEFETEKVCDTKSKTYEISTTGNLNCSLILQLHEKHDVELSMILVIFMTILSYGLLFILIITLCGLFIHGFLLSLGYTRVTNVPRRQVRESIPVARRRTRKEIPQ